MNNKDNFIENIQKNESMIIAYHNDFNRVLLPKLSVVQQNLLIGMFGLLREKNMLNIILLPAELKKFTDKNYTMKELCKLVEDLLTSFFAVNFSFLLEDKGNIIKGKVNLFKSFYIHIQKGTLDSKTKIGNLEKLEININEDFMYILNSLTESFTSFEVLEFLNIRNRHAKILYRILKQFKTTGRCCIYRYKWGEFITMLNVSTNMPHYKINERVLNPVIKELSGIFKNLRYEKIKEKGSRGQGGKVIGIEFYFDVIDTKNCIDVV